MWQFYICAFGFDVLRCGWYVKGFTVVLRCTVSLAFRLISEFVLFHLFNIFRSSFFLGWRFCALVPGTLSQQLSFQKTRQDFSTLWQAFPLRGVKKRPLLSQQATGQFSRGIKWDWPILQARSSNGWPSGPVSIFLSKQGELNRPPVSYNSQFRFFNRNWASWPSVGIRACKIGQSR